MGLINKLRKLKDFCDNWTKDCTLCPLYAEGGVCTIKGERSKEEIEKAYDLVFNAPVEAQADVEQNAPTILDSGNRREFETGAVRDIQEGKGRMDLLPWAAIIEVAKHCENGARKYGEHNVDKGIPTHSLADSASRHLAKYIDGRTDEPHLVAAAWNLLWCIQMELKHPELCDIPWRPEK